jgi:transposase
VASFAECAGRQCNGLRGLDLAADIIEKRARFFLTPDMARRSSQRFAAVVSKYCNHTPLHRQRVILERDIGLEISRAALDGWVLKVGELLNPMVAAMRRELIG